MSLGILAAFIFVALGPATGLEMLAWLLIIPAASAFLAMNFTGASTYTSLSGVRKEMRWAVPFEIGAGVMGLGLWIGSNFIA
jgi:acetyl-CoA decarbonylase/synthase complex subunit gamma